MSDPSQVQMYCSKCSQPAFNFCNNCGGWFCPLHGTPGDLQHEDPPGGIMGRVPIPSACWRDGGYDADIDGPLPLADRLKKQRDWYYAKRAKERELALEKQLPLTQQIPTTTEQESSTEPPTRTETTGDETGDTPGHPGKQGV